MDNKMYILGRKILYKELYALWDSLALVSYAVVKGEVLSQQIYGEPDRRYSGDIDILIDKKDIKLLEREIQNLGFRQRLPDNKNEVRKTRVLCLAYSHQIPSYHKEKLGFDLNVDVNYDIFWGEYEGQRYSIEEFVADTVEMEIYGTVLKTLPVEKAFVHLILHHYKEMNSLYHLSHHNRICTYMFSDIYNMLLLNKEVLTVEIISALCEKYNFGNIMYYMLYYTKKVYNDNFLEEFLFVLKEYKDEELLESYGLYSEERRKWKMSFEKRLDNDNICKYIFEDLKDEDKKKILINKTIFD